MITTRRFEIDHSDERIVREWQHDFSTYGPGALGCRMGVIGAGNVRVRLRVGGSVDGINGDVAAEATLAGAESVQVDNGSIPNPNDRQPVKLTAQLLSGAVADFRATRGEFG
jgi:hypothetical protein